MAAMHIALRAVTTCLHIFEAHSPQFQRVSQFPKASCSWDAGKASTSGNIVRMGTSARLSSQSQVTNAEFDGLQP